LLCALCAHCPRVQDEAGWVGGHKDLPLVLCGVSFGPGHSTCPFKGAATGHVYISNHQRSGSQGFLPPGHRSGSLAASLPAHTACHGTPSCSCSKPGRRGGIPRMLSRAPAGRGPPSACQPRLFLTHRRRARDSLQWDGTCRTSLAGGPSQPRLPSMLLRPCTARFFTHITVQLLGGAVHALLCTPHPDQGWAIRVR